METTQSTGQCPTSGTGMIGSLGVVVSPDGKNVYVVGSQDDSIAEFARNADGSLTQLDSPNDCIANAPPGDTTSNTPCGNPTGTGLHGPQAIAISPDGSNVYGAATDNQGIGTIAEFARNADGSLTQLSGHDCIAENTGETDGGASDCDDQVGHWS